MLQRVLEVDVPVGELPSKMVKPTHGKLYWFLDHVAQQLLKNKHKL